MVRVKSPASRCCAHSPRIRGDGPRAALRFGFSQLFSPYSRGWSLPHPRRLVGCLILPVFAGMVRRCGTSGHGRRDSPRIRGDGPRIRAFQWSSVGFSPYSRGWSHYPDHQYRSVWILPVFAGMVPPRPAPHHQRTHSPRIRGDGPVLGNIPTLVDGFSPYSRGWSLLDQMLATIVAILPVFAGMVPWNHGIACSGPDSPRIRGDGPPA